MTTPIEVRRARPEEYAAVADLTAGVYLAEGWGDELYEPVLRDVAGRAAEAQVLVADAGGRLVGTGTVATRGGRYAELAEPGDAVVRMLVTDPAARGRGTGGAIMQACLDAAVRDGCTRVRLSTQPEMAAAHRLYERLGFVRTPELDWRPVPELLLITYALDLPVWCGHCGQALGPAPAERASAESASAARAPGGPAQARGGHEGCRVAAELEPPRYCARCRRRLVVQVTPHGWSARCVEHGTTSAAEPAPARG